MSDIVFFCCFINVIKVMFLLMTHVEIAGDFYFARRKTYSERDRYGHILVAVSITQFICKHIIYFFNTRRLSNN